MTNEIPLLREIAFHVYFEIPSVIVLSCGSFGENMIEELNYN